MRSKLILSSLSTDLVPGEVEYAVLLPPAYDRVEVGLPLLINMHGGGLNRDFLAEPNVWAFYDKLWEEEILPPMVVACYSARLSWHLNYRDGSERWEDFAFAFMNHMQEAYKTRPGKAYNYLTGISMGARGALRLMLKYPNRFGAVAALEGVYDPVFNYADLQPRHYGSLHNLPPEEQTRRLGWPVDQEFYHANNHANIARDNAAVIRSHGPKIYIECGDHDFFNAHEGAEFLHRILWEHRIGHEYRLLQDCDHVGESLVWRMEEAHRWLGRMARKLIEPMPLPEPTVAQQSYMNRVYRREVTAQPADVEKMAFGDDAAILAHRRALPDFLAAHADTPFDGLFRKPLAD